MIRLMDEYRALSKLNDKKSIHKANIISNELYFYLDKIIHGVINVNGFPRFAERDDLIQEARLAVLLSIQNEQFDANKGTIFNFVSVVVARNLINYTTKLNRHMHRKSDADIDVFYNHAGLTYEQNYDKNLIIDDVFSILLEYFSGKPRMRHLVSLLMDYFKTHKSSRFIKKHFISYAKGHNYSSAMVNTFFEHISRAKSNPNIREFLLIIENDKNNTLNKSTDII